MKLIYSPCILLLYLWMMSCNTPETLSDDIPPCHKITETNTLTKWEPSDMSLYNLDSHWVNQNNDSLQLGLFQGKLQLVALMYTSCTYACPRILHDLKMIDERLSKDEKKFVNIVLVTLDPARDTPENLKTFAGNYNLDPNRWTLLASSESNVRELSGLLNVQYKQEASLEISHSNIISLLDVNGELIFQKEGLGVDPDAIVKEIKKSFDIQNTFGGFE